MPEVTLRTVLVVSYAWPPAGGPGVQRVLKFVKYLPQFGFRPVVLTVKEGAFPALDPTLEGDVPPETRVVRTFSAEPTALYKRFVGMKPQEAIPVAVLAEPTTSPKKKIANFIRLNAFVPDAKIGWFPWAVAEGSRLVKAERPDLVFSTAPPPTVHLVAGALARLHRLPWVADFRDPWTDIHYYEGHERLWPARALDHRLERAVFRAADRLTFVSRLDSEHYASVYGHGEKQIVIPNGYDEADFQSIPEAEPDRRRFVLMHLGSVGIERNPTALYAAINDLRRRGLVSEDTFRLMFVGKLERTILESIRASGIEPLVELVSYMPHHEAVAMGQRAHALLLLITQSAKSDRILPGKTFEYLRHGRPVLALGSTHGEVARVLAETQGGVVLDYGDQAGITQTLERWLSAFQGGARPTGPSPDRLARYTRKSLTEEVSRVFSAVIAR